MQVRDLLQWATRDSSYLLPTFNLDDHRIVATVVGDDATLPYNVRSEIHPYAISGS